MAVKVRGKVVTTEKENQEIFMKELRSNIEEMQENSLYEEIYYSDEIVSDIFKSLLIKYVSPSLRATCAIEDKSTVDKA